MCIRDSIHGVYPANWKGLDFDALQRIHEATNHIPLVPVSYTHLDVYKRQDEPRALLLCHLCRHVPRLSAPKVKKQGKKIETARRM